MTQEDNKKEKATKPELNTKDETKDTVTNIASEATELKVEENKPKTIEVNADKLQEMVTEFKDMRGQIERLEATANKGRTAKYDAENREATLDKVAVNFYGSGDSRKIVLAWRMMQDEITTNVNTGVMKAEQLIRLFHGDEEDFTDIPYMNFKKLTKEVGEVIKDEVEKVSGERILTVSLPEYGKSVKLNVQFVN